MSTVFVCPKCKGAFWAEKGFYRCQNGHMYDRSAGGYVNLLPPGGKQHGDDKEMLRARRDFLQSGGYKPLSDAIAKTVKELSLPMDAVMLDAGCGEGYYTQAVLEQSPQLSVYGVDVSKDAVKMCDARRMQASFAVASVYALPVADGACDLVLSVFSPFAREEFLRILRPEGYLISVIPDKLHLWGLKQVLYDTPYENEVSSYEVQDFRFLSESKVGFTLNLKTKDQIMSLYRMTPYCYRTGRKGSERIAALESLTTEVQFCVLLYQKK